MRSMLCLFVLAALLLPAAHGAEWSQWRGPLHNGSTSEESPLPEQFGPTQNVLWAAPMPGASAATPVTMGDSVFVASTGDDPAVLHALCLDRNTGALRWQKALVHDAEPNARNSMTACSPVADAERVYFYFGTTNLFAFSHDGEPRWSVDLEAEYGPIRLWWGYSSSPLLVGDRLYIPVLAGLNTPQGRTDAGSYLICLDAATGKVIWRKHRPSDAVNESLDAYTTPVPRTVDNKLTIVAAGGDYITGHDAATGEELWGHNMNPRKIGNWRLIPSALVVDDLVVGIQPRGGDVYAFRPQPGTRLPYEQTVWRYEERTADVPTPLYYQGRIYVLNGVRRSLICLDPETGREIYNEDLGGGARFWCSPTAGDGKIYCLNEAGQVVVVAAGDTFKALSRADFGGGPCQSSVAISEGRLYVRTAEKLYCIGAR